MCSYTFSRCAKSYFVNTFPFQIEATEDYDGEEMARPICQRKYDGGRSHSFKHHVYREELLKSMPRWIAWRSSNANSNNFAITTGANYFL